MMFGFGSPRGMRRSLPNHELVVLEKFYEDFIKLMGWARGESDDNDEIPSDFNSETIVVTPTQE